MKIRRLLAFLLAACLLANAAPTARAENPDERELLLGYYWGYQQEASREIEGCLSRLEQEDARQGALWRRIMGDWDRLNQAGFSEHRVLPKNLPQDDSLCIVVFGYGLAGDGSMLPELYDRLYVALNAARQYPNAYIAVTGGETSDVPGISEAGQMAAWLGQNGVEGPRLIVETESLSTVQNAVNTYDLLIAKYPQIQTLAAVTSDYHIAFAATMLQIVSDYQSLVNGKPERNVAAGISCPTDTPVGDSMLTSQARGIGMVTGVSWSGQKPALDAIEETKEPQKETLEVLAEEPPEEKGIVERFLDWLRGTVS